MASRRCVSNHEFISLCQVVLVLGHEVARTRWNTIEWANKHNPACRETVYVSLKEEKITVFSDQTFDDSEGGLKNCQTEDQRPNCKRLPDQRPCSELHEGEVAPTVASHAKNFGHIIAVDEGCMAGGFTAQTSGWFVDVSGASPLLPEFGVARAGASDNIPYKSLDEVKAFYDHERRIKGDQLKSGGWQRFRKFIQLNNQATPIKEKPWRKLQAHWQYDGESLKALGEARDLGIVLRWSSELLGPFGWCIGRVTEWFAGLRPTDDTASLLNDTKYTGINEFNHRWLYVAEGKTAEDPATYDDAEFGLHLKQMGTADGKWKPRMSEEGPGGPTWSMLSVNNACERWGDKKGRTHGNMLYDAIQKLHNRSG